MGNSLLNYRKLVGREKIKLMLSPQGQNGMRWVKRHEKTASCFHRTLFQSFLLSLTIVSWLDPCQQLSVLSDSLPGSL